MQSIFIAEDETIQRTAIREIIENYILIEDLDMEVTLDTASPRELVSYLEAEDVREGIYFLDIDYGDEAGMNGLDLGLNIRQLDSDATIIFITSHGQLAPVTFKYKIEALDFIVKGNPDALQTQVIEVLKTIVSRREQSGESGELLAIKQGRRTRYIDYDHVLYIESLPQPHKLALVTESGRYEFYDRLKHLESDEYDLLRIHRSFIVNINQIKEVDREENLILLQNGEHIPVAANRLKNLTQAMERLSF